MYAKRSLQMLELDKSNKLVKAAILNEWFSEIESNQRAAAKSALHALTSNKHYEVMNCVDALWATLHPIMDTRRACIHRIYCETSRHSSIYEMHYVLVPINANTTANPKRLLH